MKQTKRVLAVLIAIVMVLGVVPVMQASAHSYAGDYRKWSQGGSDYSAVRSYGCWIVAMSKLIYEANIDRSASFNPDTFAVWEVNNGRISSLSNVGQIGDGGQAPLIYAQQKGKDLTYFGNNWDNSNDQIMWNTVHAGYYTIVSVGQHYAGEHYVMIDNEKTKATGQLYCYDSFTDRGSVDSQPLSRYSYRGNIYVYKANNPDGIDIGNDFYAYIEPTVKVIHLENASSNVQLTAKNDDYNPKQCWHFLRQSNGSYKIVNEFDGKCLDLYGGNASKGTNIQVYEDNGSNAQRWYIFNNGEGYGIRTACGNTVMDVTDLKFSAGTNIQICDNNGSDAQRFKIFKTTYSKPAKPSAPTLSLWVLNSSNQTSWLSWTASALKDSNFDNRTYTLTLTKDGAAYQTKTGLTGTSISLTLPKGTYTATVRAINTKYNNYYTDSNTITFTVKDCAHNWGSGTVTTPATCMATGIRTFTCSLCGATRTETIGKTAHTLTVINQRNATYDAEGYTGDEYCTVCKQTIKSGTVIPKLEKPSDPAPSNPQPSGSCKWCGQNHGGAFGWLVKIIHNILAAIFGAKY